jgi:DNA repair exonuclease SbcCD ATPase subunit
MSAMPELKPPHQLDTALTELVAASRSAQVPATRAVVGAKETLVERASVEERLVYTLEERINDLEVRLRQQAEAAQLRELEMRALENDLALKEHYVARLEQEHAQIVAARDGVLVELDRIRAELAETDRQRIEAGALAAAIQGQVAYKLSVRGVAALKQTGPLYRLMRSGARVVLGR